MSTIKSVHLQNFPNVEKIKDKKALVQDMDTVRDLCSAALSIRDKKKIRVRLPLNNLRIIGGNANNLKKYKDIIANEINVKNVEFVEEIGDLAELKLNLNFRKLGERLGDKMKNIISAAKKNNWKKNKNDQVEVEGVVLEKDEYSMNLVPRDADSTGVLSSNKMLVELDTELTDDLKLEGIARDIIRLIQQDRKEANLDVSDKIELSIQVTDGFIEKAINKNLEYIKEQTLTKGFGLNKNTSCKHRFDHDLDSKKITVSFSVVN